MFKEFKFQKIDLEYTPEYSLFTLTSKNLRKTCISLFVKKFIILYKNDVSKHEIISCMFE